MYSFRLPPRSKIHETPGPVYNILKPFGYQRPEYVNQYAKKILSKSKSSPYLMSKTVPLKKKKQQNKKKLNETQ